MCILSDIPTRGTFSKVQTIIYLGALGAVAQLSQLLRADEIFCQGEL